MDTKSLLQEIEKLSYQARLGRLIELGRQAKAKPEVAAVIQSLENLDVYERYLAVLSCYGSLDGAHVLRAITDTSRLVRSTAITLVPFACNDEQAERALPLVSPKSRRRLAVQLVKAKRQLPVDHYLETLAEQDQEQLSSLLSLGSSELLSKHLAFAIEKAGVNEWRRFAKDQPRTTLSLLLQQADSAQELDQRLLRLANTVILVTAEDYPQETLQLVQSLARHIPLASLSLQMLVQRLPVEMADLVLNTRDRLNLEFNLVGHKLDLSRILALTRQGYLQSNDPRFLGRLKPDQRAELYYVFGQGWRDADGALSHEIVALLPRPLREQEGRRHLQLAALATRPQQRLPFASFLPWSEVLAELERFVRNPTPELRISGWSALIFSVRYQRERLSELLTMIRARRNEQDPIRQSILGGLAELPPSMWQISHLGDLSQIIRDALDAADLSPMTSSQVERLIILLLPFHPNWATEQLAIFVKERGRIYFHDLGSRLSDTDIRRIAPALQPVLEAWQTREREMHLVALAQGLQRRLRVFEGLTDVLERVVRTTVTAWVANNALDLILKYRPKQAHVLIPELLRTDQSWIMQQAVYTYLHRHRQDLLTPFLAPKEAYRGRFATGKVRFVLPLVGDFERWTRDQQELFAKTLRMVSSDEMRDIPAILFTIRQLEGLMYLAPTRLIALAHLDNQRLIIRDTALRALGRLDAGQGIPVLLEAMADDRARLAIYSLRSALLEMPAAPALELLRTVPLAKVTVAKEVIRLMGELRTEAAYSDLLKFYAQPLHRDVRVALLRALWDHLQHLQTWDILNEAAIDPDPSIATVVGRIPVDRLSLDSQKRLVRLLVTLMAHTDPVVRLDVLRRCYQLPVSDAEHLLITPLLAAIDAPNPDEAQAAASALFTTYASRNPDLIAQAVTHLLPKRRALQTLLQALETALSTDRSHLLATVRETLSALEADPITVIFRVELALEMLPWGEVAQMLLQMAQIGGLHADAVAAAERQLQNVTNGSVPFFRGRYYPDRANVRSDAAEVSVLEVLLRESPDSQVRRLGLAALIASAQSPLGWNADRLALLEQYRHDPAPLVAAAAQFTFPPLD